MVLLLFFVDFESDGVVVIEEDAEEVVKVDLLVPLGDLEDVVGHDQVRQGEFLILTLKSIDGMHKLGYSTLMQLTLPWHPYCICMLVWLVC